MLTACQAQRRGVTAADGAYVSTSRPALQVSVKDIPLVTHGSGSGLLREPGVMGGLSVDTWVAVYASAPDKPMAAVIHAELQGSWRWSTVWPHTGSMDARQETIDGIAFASCTFGEPAASDAFAGLAGEDTSDQAVEARPVQWLVRYMAAVLGHRDEKIVLIYPTRRKASPFRAGI